MEGSPDRIGTPPPTGQTVRKAKKDKISAKEKRDCEGTIEFNLEDYFQNFIQN